MTLLKIAYQNENRRTEVVVREGDKELENLLKIGQPDRN